MYNQLTNSWNLILSINNVVGHRNTNSAHIKFCSTCRLFKLFHKFPPIWNFSIYKHCFYCIELVTTGTNQNNNPIDKWALTINFPFNFPHYPQLRVDNAINETPRQLLQKVSLLQPGLQMLTAKNSECKALLFSSSYISSQPFHKGSPEQDAFPILFMWTFMTCHAPHS